MPQDVLSAQRKRVTRFAVSTDWRKRLTVLRAADERSASTRNGTGAIFRRTGFATCLAWALQRYARVEMLGFNYASATPSNWSAATG